MRLPDLHSESPRIKLPIRWAGLRGIIVPSGRLRVDGIEMILSPRFDVFIDLPPDLRGIHASRSYEPIAEMVEEYAGRSMKLEDMAAEIAEKLLKNHPYASRSLVRVRARAYHRVKAPLSGVKSYEQLVIYGRAYGLRAGEEIYVRRFVGVRGVGVTACPCVKEVALRLYGVENVTHMQRSIGKLSVEIPKGFDLDLLTLFRVLSSSMSAPAISNLKRGDEARLVIDAVKSPKFAEDSVREMVRNVVIEWPDLPDPMEISAFLRSMESIHPHDFVAYIKTTVGDVRKALRSG